MVMETQAEPTEGEAERKSTHGDGDASGADRTEARKQQWVAFPRVTYDEVLKELVLALGAALFLANALALYRRGEDGERARHRTVAKNRPGSPVRGYGKDTKRDLAQAPLARTVTYMVIGLVVMIWALASIVS
jgi:hypothetical protein